MDYPKLSDGPRKGNRGDPTNKVGKTERAEKNGLQPTKKNGDVDSPDKAVETVRT